MSTISYKEGIVAADTRSVNSQGAIFDNMQKLFILPDNTAIAIIGQYESGFPFYNWLNRLYRKDAAAYKAFCADPNSEIDGKPTLSDQGNVIWFTSSSIYEFNDVGWSRIADPSARHPIELSWGSGSSFALGAMKQGADARTAVEVAMSLDVYTGGEVMYHKITAPHLAHDGASK